MMDKPLTALFLRDMILPDEYKTGNKKMDDLIVKSLARDNGFRAKEIILDEYKPFNKYGVSEKEDRTYKDGTVFASKNEMERYDFLLMIQRAGQIKELQTQVPFELQEGFISRQWGDIKSITYVADFVYTNISFRKGFEERKVVEDSKTGVRTPEYKLKRKLFLYKYGKYLFFEV